MSNVPPAFVNISKARRDAFVALSEKDKAAYWEHFNSITHSDSCPLCGSDWKEPHYAECFVLIPFA